MGFQRAILIILVTLTACSSAPKKETDVLLGEPPTAKDDPFFFVAMPSAAERADNQGTIGEAKPVDSPKNAPPVGDGVQCFSCVQICVDEKSCGDGADLICGWGTHPVKEVAMTRATAECDGALNLARYAPTWAGIDGDCPIATCKTKN